MAVVTLQPMAIYSKAIQSTAVLVALFVYLAPTTIGGLLSTIGIAAMLWVGGHILLVGADTLARTIVAPAEMPIGILTAAVGAPFFLGMLLRQRGLVGL